jgi:hypothetical protein
MLHAISTCLLFFLSQICSPPQIFLDGIKSCVATQFILLAVDVLCIDISSEKAHRHCKLIHALALFSINVVLYDVFQIKISVADDLLVPLSSLVWLDAALLLPYAVIQVKTKRFNCHVYALIIIVLSLCRWGLGVLLTCFLLTGHSHVFSLSLP